jgi:hypothetical protein
MQKLIERIEELKAKDLAAAGVVITPAIPVNAEEPNPKKEKK